MTTPKGFNSKYYRLLPVFALLPVLLLFLPYVSTGGKSLNGLGMLKAAGEFKNAAGAVLPIFGGIGGLVAGLVAAAALILLFIFRNKVFGYIATFAEAFFAFFEVASFFGIKKMFDATEGFGSDFMIHDLRAGFWVLLIASIAGLWITMAANRFHTEYIILTVMSVIWLFPVFYITMTALRQEGSFYVNYIMPKQPGLENFKKMIFDDSKFHYVRWFKNTLLVATLSCIVSSLIVLQSAYVLSRIRFNGRKVIMNLLLILGMFPGFMSMIAVYYILKGMGLAQSLVALVLVYSGSASLSYYVAKGFFDTVPKSLDEAACIDGATKWHVFTKIIMPLSKPIIIYTVLTSFMGPWADYIFASVILGDKSDYYTIAMGLFNMISMENIDKYFTQFAAGAVLISIPIATLFISLQKYYVEGLSGSVKG